MSRKDDIAKNPQAFIDPVVVREILEGRIDRDSLSVPGQHSNEVWHTVVALAHHYAESNPIPNAQRMLDIIRNPPPFVAPRD